MKLDRVGDRSPFEQSVVESMPVMDEGMNTALKNPNNTRSFLISAQSDASSNMSSWTPSTLSPSTSPAPSSSKADRTVAILYRILHAFRLRNRIPDLSAIGTPWQELLATLTKLETALRGLPKQIDRNIEFCLDSTYAIVHDLEELLEMVDLHKEDWSFRPSRYSKDLQRCYHHLEKFLLVLGNAELLMKNPQSNFNPLKLLHDDSAKGVWAQACGKAVETSWRKFVGALPMQSLAGPASETNVQTFSQADKSDPRIGFLKKKMGVSEDNVTIYQFAMLTGRSTVEDTLARVAVECDIEHGSNRLEISKQSVLAWLHSEGLSEYSAAFDVHEIDERLLRTLTDENLQSMGIHSFGARRRILFAAQKLPLPSISVSSWLRENNMQRYQNAFDANDISDIGLLNSLTNEDLKDMGIASVGHRKLLMAAIEKLNAPITSSGGEVTPDEKASLVVGNLRANLHNVVVAVETCNMLIELVADKAVASSFVSNQGISSLISVMDAHSKSHAVHAAAVHVLGTLATHDDLRESLQHEQVIDPILVAMHSHTVSLDVQEAACWAFRMLLRQAAPSFSRSPSSIHGQNISDDKIGGYAIRSGFLTRLQTAIKSHQASSQFSLVALQLVNALSIRSDVMRESMASHGLFSAISSAMTQHLDHPIIQWKGCLIIGNLAKFGASHTALVSAGALRNVMGAMRNHPSVANVQDNACYALFYLVDSQEEYRLAAIQEGAVDLVVAAGEAHPGHQGVLDSVDRALCVLAPHLEVEEDDFLCADSMDGGMKVEKKRSTFKSIRKSLKKKLTKGHSWNDKSPTSNFAAVDPAPRSKSRQ